jgi:hypothetical protein
MRVPLVLSEFWWISLTRSAAKLFVARAIWPDPWSFHISGPNADRCEVHHRLITVIPLIADDLLKRLRLFDVRLRLFDLFGSGNRRFDDRRGVPFIAPCTVTATIAPVSRSTACSALCAKCVRPSFIRVTFASGSCGLVQSLFDVFFWRLRSRRARASRVGFLIPEVSARSVKNA